MGSEPHPASAVQSHQTFAEKSFVEGSCPLRFGVRELYIRLFRCQKRCFRPWGFLIDAKDLRSVGVDEVTKADDRWVVGWQDDEIIVVENRAGAESAATAVRAVTRPRVTARMLGGVPWVRQFRDPWRGQRFPCGKSCQVSTRQTRASP